MTDKVVIRLINPKSHDQDPDRDYAPVPVTVYYWHRIAVAIVIAAVLLFGLYAGVRSLFSTEERDGSSPVAAAPAQIDAPRAKVTPAAAKPDAAPPKAEVPAAAVAMKPAETQAAAPAEPAIEGKASSQQKGAPSRVSIQSRKVRRAQLTSNVLKEEPVDLLPKLIPMPEQGLVKVYLFTELSGLKGQVLFHDWYWKGKLIARVRVPVKEDKQVSATSKFIDRIMTGPWTVKVVDQHKKLYAQASFEVQ